MSVLQTEAGEIAYNSGKGQIVIFPIIYPHKVTPIISGRRQNIIGWFESNITYEQSFVLKNLEEIATINLELLQSNTEQCRARTHSTHSSHLRSITPLPILALWWI